MLELINNFHTMKLDEKSLKNVLHHREIQTDKDFCIKIISYFRPVKLIRFSQHVLKKKNLEKRLV